MTSTPDRVLTKHYVDATKRPDASVRATPIKDLQHVQQLIDGREDAQKKYEAVARGEGPSGSGHA